MIEVSSRRHRRDWLQVPHNVFADDPLWTPPLRFIERNRISASRAPFFQFGSAGLFVAYRGGQPVGRISAQINYRHLRAHDDNTGHFGFFDCVNDRDVASALVRAAATWLKQRGLSRMVGPVSFSLNEQAGCLVDGFDSADALMMPRARQWTGALLEAAGLRKEVDLLAFRYRRSQPLPAKLADLGSVPITFPEVSFRQFDPRRRKEEMQLVFDIVNDGWSGNWGFVPFSREEIEAYSKDLLPIFRLVEGGFGLLHGREVTVGLALPNINELTTTFNGRLLPANWLKLTQRLFRRDIQSYRVALMGMRKPYQNNPIGGVLLGLLFQEIQRGVRLYDPDWTEMSWILETNRPMTRLARFIAGDPAKTYRLYSMSLEEPGPSRAGGNDPGQHVQEFS